MHLSNIIVNARACLTAAETHYSSGLKGTAAEDLAALSVFIQDNLTIIDAPVHDVAEAVKEAEQAPKQ